MKRYIDVHNFEIVAGQGEVVLKSDAQSACLIIVAYDPTKKVGAVAHAMYANGSSQHRGHHSPVLRDVPEAVDEMVREMVLLGSRQDDIEISAVTGENIHHTPNDPRYQHSIHDVLEVLKERHLRLRADLKEDIGDAHIVLDVDSGEILCR